MWARTLEASAGEHSGYRLLSKAVLYIAQELAQHYDSRRVAALYGAMPLAARRREIQRVLDGEADLIVATDVLGHGVNLPCRTVLFAETDKFDGRSRRGIEPWEAAQIGGRAGRYGHHEEGHVGVVTGMRGSSIRMRKLLKLGCIRRS